MKKIIFICTSNKDRSVALVEYFSERFPSHEYRSAGINKYFTTKKGTHYLTEDDIKWADKIIFAEQIHYDVFIRNFGWVSEGLGSRSFILNAGEYKQGCVGEDYLTKAEFAIKKWLPDL